MPQGGVHAGVQIGLGRERDAAQWPARWWHAVFLERLAEDFERAAIELGKLVQKRTPWWARLISPGAGVFSAAD